MSLRVDNKKCSGCGMCAEECPIDAIEFKKLGSGFGTAVIDESICIECHECAMICPKDAIDEAKRITN